MAAINVPALSARIAAIAETYDETAPEVKVDQYFSHYQNMLEKLTMTILRHQESYWKGIRQMDAATFATCVSTKKKLGAGSFGSVFEMPVKACLKVPAGVKRVAVKVETLQTDYDRYQTPQQVKRAIAVSKKAHAIGVAPALYDVFIVFDTDGVKVVKVYEVVKGVSWDNKEWKGTQKQKAIAELKEMVHRMNKAGIIHHDLHPGNVMVTTKGVVIIDFDRANFVETEEENLSYFNSSISRPWVPPGVASDKGLKYIYHKLGEEGTIVTK
jgi:predicted Ser/Thr protein kinase